MAGDSIRFLSASAVLRTSASCLRRARAVWSKTLCFVLERLSSRRVCQDCGAIYSVSQPPTSNWTCDKCGGHVVQRADDTPEAINKRLEAYERDTVPAIALFAERGLLVEVNGEGKPDEVLERLIDAVDARATV